MVFVFESRPENTGFFASSKGSRVGEIDSKDAGNPCEKKLEEQHN